MGALFGKTSESGPNSAASLADPIIWLVSVIKYGVSEQPQKAFVPGAERELGEVPQTQEEVRFDSEDLRVGCSTGIYQKVSYSYSMVSKINGSIISYSFAAWKGNEKGRKPRLVVNCSKLSEHWKKGTVNMDSFEAFEWCIQPVYHFI